MSHASPNWKLLLECARRLTAAGRSPFTRRMLIDCVQRIDSARKEGSLNPTIQGMTDNLKGGNDSGQLNVVFHSVGWGQFILLEEAKGQPLPDEDGPVLPQESHRADVPAEHDSGLREIPPLATSVPVGPQRRIGLVGCVKDKEPEPAAARRLYRSPLFRGRKAWVQRSCSSWFILSAKYGLIHPDRWIEPYDQTLKDASPAQRRIWSQEVLAELTCYLGDVSGAVVEIHAGVEYRDSGLVTGLEDRGAVVVVPTEGLSLGEQLHFYGRAVPAPAESLEAAHAVPDEFPSDQVDVPTSASAPGGDMATFDLTLQQTYYKMGFFNIGVGYDRYVRQTEGPVRLRLGRDGEEIEGRVDRHANQNGTPRIMGGAQLKRWLQANFKPMDAVAVDLSSQDVMILDRK
jgi:hypothetical protein